jgi:hypothetical protein
MNDYLHHCSPSLKALEFLTNGPYHRVTGWLLNNPLSLMFVNRKAFSDKSLKRTCQVRQNLLMSDLRSDVDVDLCIVWIQAGCLSSLTLDISHSRLLMAAVSTADWERPLSPPVSVLAICFGTNKVLFLCVCVCVCVCGWHQGAVSITAHFLSDVVNLTPVNQKQHFKTAVILISFSDCWDLGCIPTPYIVHCILPESYGP